MSVSIFVRYRGKELKLRAEPGAPVAPLLREKGLLALPCGVGKCGKCLIHAATDPHPEEYALLGEKGIAAGLRLACHTCATEGLSLEIPHAEPLRVLTRFAHSEYPFQSLVERRGFRTAEPSLEDQRSDLQRLLDACGACKHALSLDSLAALPAFLREHPHGFGLFHEDRLVGYTASERQLAFIVDIGTTTLAVLLVDLGRKRVIATRGAQNAQSPYGADVINRIRYETEWKQNGCKGNNPLQYAVIEQINGLLQDVLRETGASDVDMLAFAGNTTMMHLLCGLPAEHIGKAPFIPATLEAMRLPASALGLRSHAPAFLLPGISSYIGADITASLLAANAHHEQPPFLLVDLGTNAETVLYANGVFYACSAAAGPCFEGATLSCGMAGQKGAIDAVFPDTEKGLAFSTLENAPARGLCGSGVLDAVSLLLETGLMDETGRLEADDSPLGRKVTDNALHLTDTIRLTQSDIREVQLAKAAVRAGMDILLREAGLSANDVACFYLAGGFGSALNPKSAVRIGLIPKELEDRVRILGNAAGFGALRYVTEKDAVASALSVICRARYLELSAHPGFTEAYVERMLFPERE